MSDKTITNFINAPDIESSTRDYAGRFGDGIGQARYEQLASFLRHAELALLSVGGAPAPTHGPRGPLPKDTPRRFRRETASRRDLHDEVSSPTQECEK